MREVKIPLIEPPITLQGRFLRIFLLPLMGLGYFTIGFSDYLTSYNEDHWFSILVTPYFFFALAMILQGYILSYSDRNNYLAFHKEYIILKKPFRRKKIIPLNQIYDIYLTRQHVIVKLHTLEKIKAKYFLTFEHIESFKLAISEYLEKPNTMNVSPRTRYSNI